MPPVTRSAKKAAKEPAAKSHDVKSSAPAAKKPKKSKEQNDESEGHAASQDKSESKNKKTVKDKDQSESSEDKNGSTADREQEGKDEKDKGKKDVMFGIRFTHPGKQLFPEAHVSKAELAQYYLDMEPRILPWIKQRPITLVRGVKGVKDNRQWVQKHPPKGLDSHMTVISLQEKGDKHYDKYMVAGSAMALVAACQMDTLEFHTWHSTQADLNKPTRVVFDLDPATASSYADKDCVPFSKVKTIAESLRNVLKACGLESYVMLTGSIGLHVMAPLKQEKDFDFVHDFAHAVVILMQNIHPELVTASPKHDHRAGKIFIDYVRNSYNQTTVMPYSTRAQARAPVACPVAWDELPSITSSRQFDIESVQKRLKAADPWAAALDQQQIVPDAYPDILLECEKKSKN